MLNHTLPLLYKGYKIRKESASLCIFYPNGLKSAFTPSTINVAIHAIDLVIDASYSIYDESGFKDANVVVQVKQKPEAIYSNKNWAA